MNTTATKFNVNDYVRVKLKPNGREILRKKHELLNARYPKAKLHYREPLEDSDGWSKWQLWELMSKFGEHIHLGCDAPFETTIEILSEQ